MAGSEHERVADPDDRVAVTGGGVHVNKWVAESGSKVPIIKYELASTRDDDVMVVLTDEIPEHIDLEDFGFHDEFHGDRWAHTDDHSIRFGTELGAEETLTTVYGVRRDSITDPSDFLGRPEISVSTDTEAADAADGASEADQEAAETSEAGVGTLSLPDPTGGGSVPTDDDGQGSDRDGESSAANAGAGIDDLDANDVAGADADLAERESGESTTDDEDGVDSADDGDGGTEPTVGDSDATTTTAGTGQADGPADTAADTDAGAAADQSLFDPERTADEQLVERFVAALQSEETDAETRAALGRELNLQLSASSSQFVEHLQSRTKERRGQLETDIENLEDSIAELYGVKADASTVASIQNETADRESLADVSAALDALAEQKADASAVETHRESLDDLESSAATEAELASTVERVEERFDALDDDVDSLEAQSATASDLDALSETVDELDERSATEETVGSLRADHDALAAEAARKDALEALETDLDAAESDLAATIADRTDSVEERVDEDVSRLESRLADLDARKATDERVDELAGEKADAADLARVEDDLQAEYVTEADITDALESRLQRTLLARTLLVGAGMSAGAGLALVATGTTAGVVLAVLGLAAFAYWWWLNDQELEPTTQLRPTRSADGPPADADGDGEDEDPVESTDDGTDVDSTDGDGDSDSSAHGEDDATDDEGDSDSGAHGEGDATDDDESDATDDEGDGAADDPVGDGDENATADD